MAKESLAGREGLFTPLSWDDIKLTHPVGGLLISFFCGFGLSVLFTQGTLVLVTFVGERGDRLVTSIGVRVDMPWNGNGETSGKLGESLFLPSGNSVAGGIGLQLD